MQCTSQSRALPTKLIMKCIPSNYRKDIQQQYKTQEDCMWVHHVLCVCIFYAFEGNSSTIHILVSDKSVLSDSLFMGVYNPSTHFFHENLTSSGHEFELPTSQLSNGNSLTNYLLAEMTHVAFVN